MLKGFGMLKVLLTFLAVFTLDFYGLGFIKYSSDLGMLGEVEGEVTAVSALPDPAVNDYPNCFYTVEVKVNYASEKLVKSTAVIAIPIMKNRKLLDGNIVKTGEKIGFTVVYYEKLPVKLKEIQLSDDIQDFDNEYLYCLGMRRDIKFRHGSSVASENKIFIPEIPTNNADLAARQARQKRIDSELEKTKLKLQKYKDGSLWRNFCNDYKQLQKSNYSTWRNGSFYAATHGPFYYSAAKARLFSQTVARYQEFLAQHNIDLILVRIPTKGELAMCALTDRDEFIDNPDWLKFYITCLEAGIEIIDPLEAMWHKRFEYPLFYFYHIVREAHPFAGTSIVTAEEIRKVLTRYNIAVTEKVLYSLVTAGYEDKKYAKRNYYPEGNPSYPASSPMKFPAVVLKDTHEVPLFQGDTDGPFIFLSNSFAAYPSKAAGASIPHYLGQSMNLPMAWFYRDGTGNAMLRSLLTKPEYLKKRRAIIMVMHPNQWWEHFPELPKYFISGAKSLTRAKVYNPDDLMKLIPEADKKYFKTDKSGALQVLRKKARSGGNIVLPEIEGKKNVMLRFHFIKHSYITMEFFGCDGVLKDTASAPPQKNKDTLELIYSGDSKHYKVFFKDIFDRGDVLISKVEVFTW